MLSFGSGFPGGIFLPILTLGALSGSVFAAAFENIGFLQVSQFPIFIILGMAGYFGAVSKAPLTAMILVTEMVGDLHPIDDNWSCDPDCLSCHGFHGRRTRL